MKTHREIAYRLDPALWVQEVLGITPHDLAGEFLRAPRGASILVLTARQVGKTTAAAWPWRIRQCSCRDRYRSSPVPRNGKVPKPIRKVKEMVIKAGAKLTSDNIYGLELANGSRVLALPGSDNSIRGLTVDAWIVADEAARLDPAIMAALRPMRAHRPEARLVMLSTAWSRTDPFWSAWEDDDPVVVCALRRPWTSSPRCISPEYLDQERRATWAKNLQARIPRHPRRRPGQPVHLGALRTRHTNPVHP